MSTNGKTYKVRIENGDFWGTTTEGVTQAHAEQEDDVYTSLEATMEACREFLKESIEEAMDYTKNDIEIVEFAGEIGITRTFEEWEKLHLASQQEAEVLAIGYAAGSFDWIEQGSEGKFGGKIVGVTPYHTVQNIGMSRVIHENCNLERTPDLKEMVNITYDSRLKLAVVEPRVKTQDNGLSR